MSVIRERNVARIARTCRACCSGQSPNS